MAVSVFPAADIGLELDAWTALISSAQLIGAPDWNGGAEVTIRPNFLEVVSAQCSRSNCDAWNRLGVVPLSAQGPWRGRMRAQEV